MIGKLKKKLKKTYNGRNKGDRNELTKIVLRMASNTNIKSIILCNHRNILHD